MLRLEALRPPLLAWLVVSAAIVVGAYMHSRSPVGVFLYTPRNWCEGSRIKPFVLGYLATLTLGSVACALVLLFRLAVHVVTRAQHLSSLLFLRLIAAFVLFLLSAAFTPVLQLVFPLAADPVCIGLIPRVTK
jgi:hypothetical protein